VPALDLALEKTAGLGARIDLVMAAVRVGLFFQDTTLVTSNITKALEYVFTSLPFPDG
jgi:26S proteasome regulatory subunit N7